jgi:transcriptional regulator with XRE-family HTH domain
MARRGDPRVLRLVVISLLAHTRMTQAQLGKAARVDQSDISDFTLGKIAPTEDVLRRLAAAAGVAWSLVVHLRRFFQAFLTAVDRLQGPVGAEGAPLDAIVEPVLLAVSAYLLEESAADTPRQSLEEARQEAAEILPKLLELPAERRLPLLERTVRARRSWALAEGACHESARLAAHDSDEALAVARLALAVAEQVPGDARWRAALRAYCQAFLGNALRVANDLAAAAAAFARARDLWEAALPAETAVLAAWRIFDLEASLRRANRQFPEALALLGHALELARGDAPAEARILLKKEHVLEQMGDIEGALAALAEAAPRIAVSGDLRLQLLHRHKTVNNLCHLGRWDEAAALLPEVQELALRQPTADLDRLRVRWLESRVAAGLGRRAEAVALLEVVRQRFTDLALPYDAALAALDLAVLHLEDGRTAEVRELATGMVWIFEARNIRREALAALQLFCAAARQEAATVELARRTIAEVAGQGKGE